MFMYDDYDVYIYISELFRIRLVLLTKSELLSFSHLISQWFHAVGVLSKDGCRVGLVNGANRRMVGNHWYLWRIHWETFPSWWFQWFFVKNLEPEINFGGNDTIWLQQLGNCQFHKLPQGHLLKAVEKFGWIMGGRVHPLKINITKKMMVWFRWFSSTKRGPVLSGSSHNKSKLKFKSWKFKVSRFESRWKLNI